MKRKAFFLFLMTCQLYAESFIQAILTDIEGTTTSISFVHDTLFPYASEHVQDYLEAHKTEPEVAAIIDEVKAISSAPKASLKEVAAILQGWIKLDKKITPLKTLQGMMWKEGYEKGEFEGHVYEDAYDKLREWKKAGFKLYVYSSGSVSAQKLLFGYSTYGDLTPLFSGHFDTTVGGKREASSYKNIAAELKIDATRILFLSDTIEELNAARGAGMQTCLVTRSEDYVHTDHASVIDMSGIKLEK